MAFEKCDRICNGYGISKFVYLASATLVAAGLIIECILIHLVVIPYLSESNFINTTCTYNTTGGQNLSNTEKCENKCSKERGVFPCIRIFVSFLDVNNVERIGNLFDFYKTYANKKDIFCAAISPCTTRVEDNREWIRQFNRSLYQLHTFKCFYKADTMDDVLLYKIHPFELMINSVVWPTAIFLIGIFVITATYFCAGCRVWGQDKTVIA